jgi:CheY-like chemotaxis protein
VVALRELLATPALEAEVMCHAKGLAFHVEIAEAWVETDPDLVRRVASNLLSNAVRYTPAGGVAFTARVEGAHALLTVADSGIGIAEADREHIFGEFVQLANPARDREKGVGLGLSIVKRICDLMGTPIAMTSAPGRGTSFSVRVPLASTAVRGEREAVPVPAGSDAFKGARVWIVEDDPLVRGALALQLSAWGATCCFAASMADVLARHEADGRWPDAALLDDMLGKGGSGLEIASWLATRMPRECIALVTGNVDADRLAELEASGLEVLRKPLSSGDLARCLWKAMRATRAATAVRDREPAG